MDHWGWIKFGPFCSFQMCDLMTSSIRINPESLLKCSFLGLTSTLDSQTPWGGSRGSACLASLRKSRWISQQFRDKGAETYLTHIFPVTLGGFYVEQSPVAFEPRHLAGATSKNILSFTLHQLSTLPARHCARCLEIHETLFPTSGNLPRAGIKCVDF